MNIVPTGETLGTTVEGVNLNRELDHMTFAAIRRAPGEDETSAELLMLVRAYFKPEGRTAISTPLANPP